MNDFLDDLETELVGAAHRRAARPRRRLPSPPVARSLTGALVMLALVAALVLAVRPLAGGSADDRAVPPPAAPVANGKACAPPPAMYEAVPALRRPPAGEPPAAVTETMAEAGARGAWRPFARSVQGQDGLEIWVVPSLACDNPRDTADRPCLVLLRDGRWAGYTCRDPTGIRTHGTWIIVPVDGGLAVAGFAPAGATYVEARRDGAAPHQVPVIAGVYAGELPSRFGDDPMSERIDITLMSAVTVLNDTAIPELGQAVAERLDDVTPNVADAVDRLRQSSTVLWTGAPGRDQALDIARALGIRDVRPAEQEPDLRALAPHAAVIVVAGEDLALGLGVLDVVVLNGSGIAGAAEAAARRIRAAVPAAELPGAGITHVIDTEPATGSGVRYGRGSEMAARQIAKALGGVPLIPVPRVAAADEASAAIVVEVDRALARRLVSHP